MPVIRRAQRDELAPRIEMMPLIDVVFLLLTFFISSLLVMVQAEVLPVRLVGVGSGQEAEPGQVNAVTVDRDGQLYWNRVAVDVDTLDGHLAEVAEMDPQPPLFVALEEDLRLEPGEDVPVRTDRGPLVMRLVQRAQEAGVENFSFVGRAGEARD